MSQAQLAECRLRLQRKLAACHHQGWYSGRVDRLEEALRAIEREMRRGSPAAPSRAS